MENPASGVMAAIEVLVTDECPPTKICGTDCTAVTLTALQGGRRWPGRAWKHCTFWCHCRPGRGEGAVLPHPGDLLSVAPDPLSVSAYGELQVEVLVRRTWVLYGAQSLTLM